MTARAMRSALTPWAGLFLGAASWFLDQQAGAGANYWDCKLGGPLMLVSLAVVCGVVTIAGGLISWRARRIAGDDQAGTRRFSGVVGAASAGIFLLAIVFDTIASLIVPACAR
jgi:hypothetical protein